MPWDGVGPGTLTGRWTGRTVSSWAMQEVFVSRAPKSHRLRKSKVRGSPDRLLTADSAEPVPVASLSAVSLVRAGAVHSLAVKDDGTARACGSGNVGQLGNGDWSNSRRAVSRHSGGRDPTCLNATCDISDETTRVIWQGDTISPEQAFAVIPPCERRPR